MKMPVLILISLLSLLSACAEEEVELAYYKQIAEIVGLTSGKTSAVFILKIDMAYVKGDRKTQEALGALRPVIRDDLRQFLGTQTVEEFASEREQQLKNDIVRITNEVFKRYERYKSIKGIQEVAIIQKEFFEYN